MFGLAGLYLFCVNALTFAAFASDKRRARDGDRRIPERTLLQLAAFGGSPAAIAAQQLLRHKTRKEPFRTLLALIVFVQVVLLAGGAIWATR